MCASVTAANANARCLMVFIETSTILRARRDDAAAWQCDRADKTGPRLVARAAHFHAQAFSEVAFEIGFADVANPEPRRRRSLGLPALSSARAARHVDGQVGVRISPIDLRQRAVQRD